MYVIHTHRRITHYACIKVEEQGLFLIYKDFLKAFIRLLLILLMDGKDCGYILCGFSGVSICIQLQTLLFFADFSMQKWLKYKRKGNNLIVKPCIPCNSNLCHD
jgi:hypothetical protein